MKTFWFRAKKYGYGWTPCTWQGWLVIAFFILLSLDTFLIIDASSHSGSDTLIAFVPLFLMYLCVLIFVSYKTGEKPRWRWGE